jgi:hypothetical protein
VDADGKRGLVRASYGLRAASAGAVIALVGCRSILGIHDQLPIDCLTASDCPPGDTCGSDNKCVSPAGPDASDEPLATVEDGAPSNADGPGEAEAGAAMEDGPSAHADASADVSGPAATMTDATMTDATMTDAPANDAPSNDVALNDAPSNDVALNDAPSNDAADTGDGPTISADAGDADDANDEDLMADASNTADSGTDADDSSDTCGVGPSGACAACTGACTVQRPGWLSPENGGFAPLIPKDTFVAVAITLAQPSWLMRLGVDTTTSGVTGQLALYTDSTGQPGQLVVAVDMTTHDDPQTDGSEQSVPCNALCRPLAAGNYWVGALFDVGVFVRTDGEINTTLYQATSASYGDGGTLDNGIVPTGTTTTGALDRNLYVVVTQP